MRFVILLGMLCSALLVGCGNRDKQRLAAKLEEELAKLTKVDVEVPAEFAKAKAELVKAKAEWAKWAAKLAKVEFVEVPAEFAKEKEKAEEKAKAVKAAIYREYGGEARCPKCSEDLDIDRIELEKISFYDKVRAKVYVNCPEHGNQLSEVSEWDVSGYSVEQEERLIIW